MGHRPQDDETICALATPPGVGGIGVIRVSGPRSLEIFKKLARAEFESLESHKVRLCLVYSAAGEAIDEILFTYFGAGKSYTGEETIEISFHGSTAVAQSILRELIHLGARQAAAGEFTYRAFLNGKIDLIQAESVLALIEARTEKSSRMALRNLKGQLSGAINTLEEQITMTLAQLEANLDFSEENLEVESQKALQSRMRQSIESIDALLQSYKRGRVYRDGIRVAIHGAPNVGKSSLLNALVGEDRAIVSSRPGTTRDTIEAEAIIQGVRVQFVDTAGIRDSADEIELMGIERAKQEAQSADVVLRVFDVSQGGPLPTEKSSDREVVVLNKSDLLKGEPASCGNGFLISAKLGRGLAELRQAIYDIAVGTESDSAAAFQARHYECLTQARTCLTAGHNLLVEGASPEFVIAEVQSALSAIYEVLG